jgi:NAD(P)-dependent dehydrogenase (short-subunit alcohol dehydrogenase family)
VAHSETWSAGDLDVDMTGRHVIVCGQDGMAHMSAMALAYRRATVHLVTEEAAVGESLQRTIAKESQNSDIHVHSFDMSDVAAVKLFATQWVQSGVPINALLLSTRADLVPSELIVKDAMEVTWATAINQSFLLCGLLLPCLVLGKGTVVNVSAGGGTTIELDLSLIGPNPNGEKFDGLARFACAKRAQIMLAELWATRLPGKPWLPVRVHSMHPGWCDTPGGTIWVWVLGIELLMPVIVLHIP